MAQATCTEDQNLLGLLLLAAFSCTSWGSHCQAQQFTVSTLPEEQRDRGKEAYNVQAEEQRTPMH